MRREAVLSSQIEGTQSSLSDLLLFELEEASGAPFDDVVEVSSYVAVLSATEGTQRISVIENKSGRTAIEWRTIVDASGDADVCGSVAPQSGTVPW